MSTETLATDTPTYANVYATLTDRYGETHPEEWMGTVETWALDVPGALAPWKKVRREMVLDAHGMMHSGGGHRVSFRFERVLEDVTA